LVGGGTAVWEGWRDTTIDIDLKADLEPTVVFEAIAILKEKSGINVELTSPDLFIPILPRWRERSVLVLQQNKVTIRHYDFYAQALANPTSATGEF
jgi:hypothetical protein